MRRTFVAALALTALLPLQAMAASVTVKPGDTLSDIAARYGISVGALMRMNGIRNADHVEVGQRLQVPGPRLVAGSGRHKVQSGDTLSVIALRYRVSERDLIALNNLPSADHVELGDTLKLPSNAVLPKPKAKTVAKAKPVPIKADPKASAHTVARGQTLTQIAKAYQVPVASLIALNSIANPDKVEVGTKLMLRGTATPTPAPTAKPTQTAKPSQTATPAPTAKPVQTAKASATPAAQTVQPNDADWRTYGPLQVDWANWQSMGGSDVAPTLNADGKPLYVAVNCGAKKINVTGANGGWKTWSAPQTSFEEDLVKDRCTAKGG